MLDCYEYEGPHARIEVNPSGIREGGEAVFRLEAESEHYRTSYEFTVVFMNRSEVAVTVDFDTLRVPVSDEPLAVHTVLGELPVHVTPEIPFSWRLAGGRWLDRSGNADEAEMLLKNYDFDNNEEMEDTYLQVRIPGEYEMEIDVYAGLNQSMFSIPVILEGTEPSSAAGFELRNQPAPTANPF